MKQQQRIGTAPGLPSWPATSMEPSLGSSPEGWYRVDRRRASSVDAVLTSARPYSSGQAGLLWYRGPAGTFHICVAQRLSGLYSVQPSPERTLFAIDAEWQSKSEVSLGGGRNVR